MKRKKQMFEFVLTSVFGAIIMLLALIPNLGYVTIFPGVSITLVHIPVLIGVFILSIRSSLILGLFFGVSSLIASYMYGVSPFDLAFRNPLIAIIPRVLFALGAFYIVKMFKKLFTIKHGKYIMFGLLSVITIFVTTFGLNSMFKKIIYNSHDSLVAESIVIENELTKLLDIETPTDEQLLIIDGLKVKQLSLTIEIPRELNKANAQYNNLRIFIYTIIGVISLALIILYYFNIIIKNSKNAYIPTALILSTILHTILVLGTVSIANPKTFNETFGNNNNVITTIFIFMLINGFIEAIFAALIGTPIAIAMEKRLAEEE